MKYAIFLFALIAFVNSSAQQMPVPDPNTTNVLFLKYSKLLNEEHSFIPKSNISKYPEPVNFKPVYLFFSFTMHDASGNIMRNCFYIPNPEEFAYIEPTTYEAVALSRVQLIDILKTKTTQEWKNYLNSFDVIYLIDYEQHNPRNPNQVKILKVKPHYNFLKY